MHGSSSGTGTQDGSEQVRAPIACLCFPQSPPGTFAPSTRRSIRRAGYEAGEEEELIQQDAEDDGR
eukprot:4610162-Prymnesium_polylepis.1